jgi:hypothetical protein
MFPQYYTILTNRKRKKIYEKTKANSNFRKLSGKYEDKKRRTYFRTLACYNIDSTKECP